MNTEQLEKWLEENCFCAGECSSGASVVAPNDLRALLAGKVLVPVEAAALDIEEFIAAKKYYTTIANPEEMDGTESVSVAELREFMHGQVATASPQAAVPELLAALKMAAESAGFQYMLFETRDFINAAIAKAERTE